jgi:hypothetical protein
MLGAFVGLGKYFAIGEDGRFFAVGGEPDCSAFLFGDVE